MIDYNKELNFYVFALESIEKKNFKENPKRGFRWLESMYEDTYGSVLPTVNYYTNLENLISLATKYNTGFLVVSKEPTQYQAVTFTSAAHTTKGKVSEVLAEALCDRLVKELSGKCEILRNQAIADNYNTNK